MSYGKLGLTRIEFLTTLMRKKYGRDAHKNGIEIQLLKLLTDLKTSR